MARLIGAAVVTTTALAGTPLPASAGRTTLTAPYARSATWQWCDFGAVCRTAAQADAATGDLLVDLSVLGTKRLTASYCPHSWPPDPKCLTPRVGPAGGTGRATVGGTHTLTEPVTSVSFTVTVRTDEATAQSSSGEAVAYVWASASPASSSSCWCYGGIFETVADSDTLPTATATTRTLRFTYKNSNGGKVPSGLVDIAVGITAWAGGEGPSSVRLPATVLSVAVDG